MTHDWGLCHLCIYPYRCQVRFKVASLQSAPPFPVCDSSLSSSFCLLLLSAATSLDSSTTLFLHHLLHDFPFVSVWLLGHWLIARFPVVHPPFMAPCDLWLSSVLSLFLSSLLLLTWVTFTSLFFKVLFRDVSRVMVFRSAWSPFFILNSEESRSYMC